MSAPTASTAANSITHSLIHWLALGGVGFDVGDSPAAYHAPAQQQDIAASDTYNKVAGTATTTPARAAMPAKPQGSAPSSAPSIAINIEKFASYDDLAAFYASWKTLGLAKTASRAVLPQGKLSEPRLMVISDFPDDSEDRYGEAFTSPANAAIRKALLAAGFGEDEILYTYLSKWRTPAKRPLTVPERDICMQLLSQEIGFARPQAILTFGESTIRALVPDSASKPIKNLLTFSYTNQLVNKELTVFASPKGEFLLKNAAMKKSFWFSLLDLADRKGA